MKCASKEVKQSSEDGTRKQSAYTNLHCVINLMHVSQSSHELPRSCPNEVQGQCIVPTFTKASSKALCVSLCSIKTDFTLLF